MALKDIHVCKLTYHKCTYHMYQIQILPSETFWPVVWPPPRSKGMFRPDGNFVRNPHEGDDHREDALNFICWGTFETLLTSSLLSFRRRIYTSNWRQNSSNKRTKTIWFMSHQLWYHPLEKNENHLIQNIRFFNKFEVLFTDIYSITTREKNWFERWEWDSEWS